MNTPSLRDRLAALAAMGLLTPAIAQAYIDPGFGALLLQAGVAAVAGALFFFRRTFVSLGAWFRTRLGRGAVEVARPTDDGPDR